MHVSKLRTVIASDNLEPQYCVMSIFYGLRLAMPIYEQLRQTKTDLSYQDLFIGCEGLNVLRYMSKQDAIRTVN